MKTLLDMAQKYQDDEDAYMARQMAAQMQALYDEDMAARGGVPRARTELQDPSLLNVGGIGDRLALINKYLNPVEAIGESMRAGSRMMSPDVSGYDRVAALGDMLSGVAGVAGPAAVAKRVGAPAANAVMESLLGASPTAEAVADMARKYAVDESGALRLYHGSPHDFDRFSMSKIGTGEGAQAYGHGLYFAENEGVARGYRDQLSRPYLATSEGQNIAEKYGDDVANIFEMAGGEPDDMRATVVRLRKIVKENLDDIGVADVSQLKSEFYGDLPSTIIDFSNRADRLESLLNSGDVKLVNTGRMYEVEVNANPEDFLDWDRPFASADDVERFAARFDAVDPALRKRIEDFGYMRQQMGQPMPDGNDIIREVMGGIGSKDAARASETMREAGIPGIRYLDAGSRGAGDGSRNYVIFDENLINIVRKYGIAGAAAALGVSQAEVAQAMGQGGASQYDPDAIETTASRVRENKFAAGGAVKYDPGAVDRIITKLREVNRG